MVVCIKKKIIDPGHKYQLNHLDGDDWEILTFVKREGDKYPGNKGHYEGTNIQEVMRVLIDRLKYLNNQDFDSRNLAIIRRLRDSIWFLESRAAERHQRELNYYHPEHIEDVEVCKRCGHIGCTGQCLDEGVKNE